MGHPDDRDERSTSSSSFASWFQPGDLRPFERQDRLSQQQRRRLEHDLATNSDNDPHETNPFVAFKNFVDGHLAAIVHLPSNIAELRRRAHEEDAAQRDWERDLQRRWTGHEHLEGTPASRYVALSEEAKEDAQDALDLLVDVASTRLAQRLEKPGRSFSERTTALYYDPEHQPEARETPPHGPNLSVGGACYYKSEANDNLPSLASLTSGAQAPSPSWLSIDWFKHSAYSPISLEADPDLERYDTKWRHAFEDLLEVALDKPMSSRERFGMRHGFCPLAEHPQIVMSTWRAPGLDWMLSLQCRGILPLRIPSSCRPEFLDATERSFAMRPGYDDVAVERHYEALLHEIATPQPDAREHSYTELDVYEQQCSDEVGRAVAEAIRQEREMEGATCPDPLGWEVAQVAREEREYNSGGCPDPLGRAVAEAVREEREFNSGGCPDPLGRAIAEAAREEHDYSSGGCPDPLGRAVAEAAREEREFGFDGCPDPLGRAVADTMCEGTVTSTGSFSKDLSNAGIVLPRQEQGSETQSWIREHGWTDDLRELLDERDRHEREFVKACQLGTMTVREYQNTQTRLQSVDTRIRLAIESHAPQMRARARLLGPESADKCAEEDDLDDEDDEDDLPGELWSEARRAREQLAYEQAGDRTEQPSTTLPGGAQRDSRILASLTTTHTTTMPDGTVVTTRTLKTRFADGFEDSHESVHTSRDEVRRGGGAVVDGGEEEKGKKKGWFWL